MHVKEITLPVIIASFFIFLGTMFYNATYYDGIFIEKTINSHTFFIRDEHWVKYNLRLAGVDIPKEYEDEAYKYTQDFIKRHSKYLKMQYDVVRIDENNIVIAYLWSEWAENHFVWLNIKATRSEYEIKRKMLNAQLILKGYAKYKHIPGNEKYADFFEEFEQEAKKKKLGIWKEK